MSRSERRVVAALAVMLTVAAAAQAAITGVVDSRVQGFFGVNAPTTTPPALPLFPAGGTLLTDPPAIPGTPPPVAPPVGSANIAGALGVNYVDFTFPGGRNYFGNLNGVTTGTAITGGFFAPGTSVANPFVLVPLNSFLLQDANNPLTQGTTSYTHLNFSIDYQVNSGGLAGDDVFAFYNVFGNAFGAGTAQFEAVANYWFDPVGGPVAFTDLGAVGVNDLELSFASAAAGPYNQVLLDGVTIAPIAGAGILRINGYIRWQGIVPAGANGQQRLELNPQPEPATWALLGVAVLGLGVFTRRRFVRRAA